MDDEQNMDDIIANLTDQIIASDSDVNVPSEVADQVETIHLLNQIIGPRNELTKDFRQSLRSQLKTEWDQNRRKQAKLRLIPFHRRYARQLIASVASILVVILTMIAIAEQPQANPTIVGTASGEMSSETFVVIAIFLLGAASIVYLYYKRK